MSDILSERVAEGDASDPHDFRLESQLSWGKASELQFIFKALISCLRFVWLSKKGGEQWFSWWLHGCVVENFYILQKVYLESIFQAFNGIHVIFISKLYMFQDMVCICSQKDF